MAVIQLGLCLDSRLSVGSRETVKRFAGLGLTRLELVLLVAE
jgi:hypothetical protein